MFIYTLHAKNKLTDKDNKQLKIIKKRIEQTTLEGFILEIDGEVITKIGNLDKDHSLCVIYRLEKKATIIITFYAAKKGRYERKVLH